LSTKHQAAVLGSKRKRVTGLSDPTTSLTTEFFDSIGHEQTKSDRRMTASLRSWSLCSECKSRPVNGLPAVFEGIQAPE
jgi:hypothetical protein